MREGNGKTDMENCQITSWFFFFFLFSSFTMTILLKFPFPPFSSAEVWSKGEVLGLLLPDSFFGGNCRCIQQHAWGSSLPAQAGRSTSLGLWRALSTAMVWLPWPRAKSEISTTQATQWHPGMCPKGMYNEFLLVPVWVAVNSLAAASLSPWLWKQGEKGCVHPPGYWCGFPLVHLSVSPSEILVWTPRQKGGNEAG